LYQDKSGNPGFNGKVKGNVFFGHDHVTLEKPRLLIFPGFFWSPIFIFLENQTKKTTKKVFR
jgi:hypothetical protein